MSRDNRSVRLSVYVKECCPLCDDALHVIEEVRRQTPFDVDVVDITTDRELFERYRDLIPVVAYKGEDLFYGKVSAHRLRQLMRAAAKGADPNATLTPRYKAFLNRLRILLRERNS